MCEKARNRNRYDLLYLGTTLRIKSIFYYLVFIIYFYYYLTLLPIFFLIHSLLGLTF